MENNVLAQKYKKSINMATNWLKEQQNEDGSIKGYENGAYYYRLIWTFAVLGNTSEATKLLSWFRKEIWEKDGFTPENVGELRRVFTYVVSNIAIGAHLLGSYDISYGCLYILKKYKGRNNGFSNSDQNLKPNGWQESWITAQIGMLYLLMGDIETAKNIGEFLIKVWNKQPNLPSQLFYCVDEKTDELIIKSEEKSILYVINANEKRQCFWVPGLIAGFLGQLYLATKDKKYLDYGMKYQDFVQSCTEEQFEGIEVCKTGLGSAILYQITKEQRYLNWSIKVGDYFVNTQREDGCWPDDRFNPSSIGKDIAITDQQALWLNYILSALN